MGKLGAISLLIIVLILSLLGMVDVFVFIEPYVGEAIGFLVSMAIVACVVTVLTAAEKSLRKDGLTGF